MARTSKTIKVPSTVDGAATVLAESGILLNDNEWGRAAIVSAHCGPGGESYATFARRGIVGLRDAETVSRYGRAWIAAAQAGLTTAALPGDTVALPDADFGAYYPGRIHADGDIGRSPEAIARAVANNPRAAEAAAAALPAEQAVGVAQRALRDEGLARQVMSDRQARAQAPHASLAAIRDEADLANPARANAARRTARPDDEGGPAPKPTPQQHVLDVLTVETQVRTIVAAVRELLGRWGDVPVESREYLAGLLAPARADLTAMVEGAVSDEQINAFLGGAR